MVDQILLLACSVLEKSHLVESCQQEEEVHNKLKQLFWTVNNPHEACCKTTRQYAASSNHRTWYNIVNFRVSMHVRLAICPLSRN